jgi:photosystem II stability/assembly factor-like uncharacterized protein
MEESSSTTKTLFLAAFVFLLGHGYAGPQVSKAEDFLNTAEKKWEVIGPGGGGGQFIPTVNPADKNNVFERCDMTGAYVTYDGGNSWRMFNLRTVVRDFEFDPRDPNTVYAANTGLYRSEDRGRTWNLVLPNPRNVVAERMMGDHADQWFETADDLPDGPIDQVRVDPSNSKSIYLGLAGYLFPSASARGNYSSDSTRVLFSADRGKTWRRLGKVYGTQVLAIFPGSWEGRPEEITVIADREVARFHLKTGEKKPLGLPAGRLLAADGGKSSAGSLYYILAGLESDSGIVKGGLYRSSDRGESWDQANGNLVTDLPPAERLPRLRTLAVCEGDPQVVYLSCGSFPVSAGGGVENHFGIWKSEDAGSNWRWVYEAGRDSVIGSNYRGGWMDRSYGPSWQGYPLCLGVSPTDSRVCYVTDYGASYRTLDGGATWEQVYSRTLPDSSVTTRGLDVTTCYGLHFDPFDRDHFFISYTDIGLFQTYNRGKSWVHAISGVPEPWINTCYWLVFDPLVKGRIWSVWANCHDLPRPKMFRGDFSRFQGGVALSDDGGKNWRQTTEGMPANAVCTHILLDPESPVDSRTLYVCGFGKGVFKSTDSGASWVNKSNGLGPNLNAWRMERLPDGTLFLLVARGGPERGPVVDGALYRSADQAESWRQVALPEDVNAPNDLVFDPSNPGIMYLSCWPWPKEGREHAGGLLKTENGGLSWKRVFYDDAHVYAAAVDPVNPATIYLNTFDSGAFRSDDRGENWYRLEGYNFKWGHRPVPDPHNPTRLYLTTFGGSVFYGPAEGIPGAFEDIVERWVLRWE